MKHWGWACALAMLAGAGWAQGANEPAIPPPPALPTKLDVEFGPYTHYYKTRATADLKKQLHAIVGKLRGLNKPCPTCKRKGLVRVVIREGYYDEFNVWVPAVEDVRECPTCRRRKDVFNQSVANRFLGAGMPPQSRSSRGSSMLRRDLMRRLEDSHNPYRGMPKLSYDIRGRYAVVKAKSGDGLFPLNFMLIPRDTKFAWYIHDPAVSGEFKFATEFRPVARTSKIKEVYAGDVIVLGRDRVVRLAGITIPGPDGKVLKPGQSTPDAETRALVRSELLGKLVELTPDKYAQFSCRGLPLAFVKIDGKDYGVELVRRGLARRHPKHKTQHNKDYMNAEKEARARKAGCWAQILKD